MFGLDKIVKMNNTKKCKYCYAVITEADNLKTICNLCKEQGIKKEGLND